MDSIPCGPMPAISRSHIRASHQSASLDALDLERGIKLMIPSVRMGVSAFGFPSILFAYLGIVWLTSTRTYIAFAVHFMFQIHSGLGGWVQLIKRQQQQQQVLHLCWYDDLSSYLTTWQVINDQMIWRRASGRGDKSTCYTLTSLSSGTCHWRRHFCFWESLERRRRCLRDFSVVFLCVPVCLKSVFSDGQDVKYDRDTTPHPHPFHGTNSHEVTQIVHRKWG